MAASGDGVAVWGNESVLELCIGRTAREVLKKGQWAVYMERVSSILGECRPQRAVTVSEVRAQGPWGCFDPH